jgi:DNA-binding MarR family transcriptional regulator
MNKTVELVNAWGTFEEQYPDASIADFCRFYLTQQQKQGEPLVSPNLTGGLQPNKPEALLSKVMGRIVRLHQLYGRIALEGTGISQFEEFALLNTIFQLKDPRKTDVIYATIYEMSTGTDLLNRLRKNGYITEVTDPADRRSKRVKITAKGEKVLQASMKRLSQLVKMMLHDMGEESILLCIQLLKNVEIKFSERWPEDKGRSFDEIYTAVMSGL